jgi:hypothetical protein
MAHGTYGWESLKAADPGRRLIDEAERHEVKAKIRTAGGLKDFKIIRVWSRQAGYSHIVLDTKHSVVAQGHSPIEKDSWAMAERILKHKGLLAGEAAQAA